MQPLSPTSPPSTPKGHLPELILQKSRDQGSDLLQICLAYPKVTKPLVSSKGKKSSNSPSKVLHLAAQHLILAQEPVVLQGQVVLCWARGALLILLWEQLRPVPPSSWQGSGTCVQRHLAQQTPRGVAAAGSAAPLPSPCPPHQRCYSPAPPSGSPASRGAGEKERKERER